MAILIAVYAGRGLSRLGRATHVRLLAILPYLPASYDTNAKLIASPAARRLRGVRDPVAFEKERKGTWRPSRESAGAFAPRIVLIITLMTACQSPDNFDSAVREEVGKGEGSNVIYLPLYPSFVARIARGQSVAWSSSVWKPTLMRRCADAPSSREFQRRRPGTKRAGGTGPARPTAAYPSALIIRDKTLVRSVIEGVTGERLRAPTARTRSRLFPADRNLGTIGTRIDISINLPRAYSAWHTVAVSRGGHFEFITCGRRTTYF